MTLQEYVDSLPKRQQFQLAIKLTKKVLPIWENFAKTNKTTYRDSVVGLTHSINKELLRKTIYSVEKYFESNFLLKSIIKNTQLKLLKQEFQEPIVAFQDLDWELPYEVLMTFYSIHNLLNVALDNERTVFDETIIYVTVNQAIDALESSKSFTTDEIKNLLYNENGR